MAYTLDSENQKLEAVLAGAVSTSQPKVTVVWRQYPDYVITEVPQSGSTETTLNGATDVTILAAPPKHNYQREILNITVHNLDTATVTVTVKKDDNGTETKLKTRALNPNESLIYEHGVGWQEPILEAPFIDSTALVKGSADSTKLVRIEADGLTTGTTRVATMPDADIKLAGHATGLTANRIPYASGSTGGVLTDSANLTFDGSNMLVTGEVGINVASPGSPLDILAASNAVGITVRGRSSDGAALILFTSNDASANAYWIATDDNPRTLTIHHGDSTAVITCDASHCVGIGNTNPSAIARLAVVESDAARYAGHFQHSGTPTAALAVSHTNATASRGLEILFTTAHDNNTSTAIVFSDGTSRFIVFSDGDVQNHDNSYGAISDERLKTNIVDAGSQLDDFRRYRFRNYEFIADVEAGKSHRQIGLIAQEVLPISPGLVNEGPDGMYSMQYSVLSVKAAKAVQELIQRTDEQAKEIERLKAALVKAGLLE